MELLRRFTTAAPTLRTFHQDKPTLLVSWWCTFYAITVILFRVCGRYIRTERIYIEDGLMMVAVVPLLARMALVHVVLLYGTNNTETTGLTATDIQHRQTGSQLVLASRIMYAAYLWMIKYSVSMYLRTLTESVWQRSHQKMLRYLHIFLAVSFFGTVVSDLGACQPFSNYWQVVPDPGPQCRQGYAQFLTTGVLNILTNITLIIFPIPMILKSRLSQSRKTGIILRMALPLAGVLMTCYQVPKVINRLGEQQFRSLLASFDILLATFTSNAVVLGSLLQDRGYKKTKYKHGDAKNGFNARKGNAGGVAGRELAGREIVPTKMMHDRWGSDEDLMRTSSGGDKGSVVIGLEEMPSPVENRKPNVPPPAKFSEIRVASTWEIQVDRGDGRD